LLIFKYNKLAVKEKRKKRPNYKKLQNRRSKYNVFSRDWF